MTARAPWGAVGEFAASRHGAFHRRQAAESGLTPSVIARLIREGMLEEPIPGVLVADLGSVDTADVVEAAFNDAWRRRVSLAWMRSTAERLHRPGQSGTRVLLELLDAAEASGRPLESPLEAHSARHHSGTAASMRDGSRDDRLLAVHWTAEYLTQADLHRPAATEARVRSVVRRRAEHEGVRWDRTSRLWLPR